MKRDYSPLMRFLNHSFEDEKLLALALTHRSVASENNERLEFLGDALLNFIIGEALFSRYPDSKEGELSRMRANLVNGDVLAEIARDMHLSDYLIMGESELKSGGFERSSVLADALEAIIAAIYLDSDFKTCEHAVIAWYGDKVIEVSQMDFQKDPKTRLQEYLQSKQQPLPVYTLEKVTGKAHEQFFFVSCYVEGLERREEGEGKSRRRAEQQAAEKLLNTLQVSWEDD